MSAILSFLGGSAFRAIWGEMSAWFTKRQDAKLEIARMKVEGELEEKRFARQKEMVMLQHQQGVQNIRVQADAAADAADAAVFREAMAASRQAIGIKWVDAWNGCIRPAFGTLALVLILLQCHREGWAMVGGIAEVVFSIVGFYFADRTLRKAGK